MRAFLAFLLLSLAFAGCLDEDQATRSEPIEPRLRAVLPDEDPLPMGAGHDHSDPAQHNFLWNYDFAGRDPLLQNDFDTAGLHALDRVGDRLFGAVYGAHTVSVNGGIVVWDISDPAHPSQLGSWYIPGDVGGDRSMEATDDGAYVVLGTETTSCAGHVNPLGAAINAFLLDVRNPELITVADVLTVAGVIGAPGASPGSVHSVAVHRIDGQDYAFLMGETYKIARSELGARFEPVQFTLPTSHDHYVRSTPWGDTWALTTTGPGMEVWNVTDPYNAVQIGAWDVDPVAPGANTHYTHTTDVAFHEDDITIVVTSEDWEDHVSPLWVINGTSLRGATSVQQLETLGTWWNPSDAHSERLRFSLHNPRFTHEGILTIASYHAGMWQLDLRHPDQWIEPEPIAYAVYAEGDPTDFQDPVHEAQTCGFISLPLDAPTLFDVELHDDGTVYAADPWLGLTTFTPSAEHPVFGTGTAPPNPQGR